MKPQPGPKPRDIPVLRWLKSDQSLVEFMDLNEKKTRFSKAALGDYIQNRIGWLSGYRAWTETPETKAAIKELELIYAHFGLERRS